MVKPFTVEAIQSHKGKFSKSTMPLFQVKWQGYEETTMEPWSNVNDNVFCHKYLRNIGKQQYIPEQFIAQAGLPMGIKSYAENLKKNEAARNKKLKVKVEVDESTIKMLPKKRKADAIAVPAATTSKGLPCVYTLSHSLSDHGFGNEFSAVEIGTFTSLNEAKSAALADRKCYMEEKESVKLTTNWKFDGWCRGTGVARNEEDAEVYDHWTWRINADEYTYEVTMGEIVDQCPKDYKYSIQMLSMGDVYEHTKKKHENLGRLMEVLNFWMD